MTEPLDEFPEQLPGRLTMHTQSATASSISIRLSGATPEDRVGVLRILCRSLGASSRTCTGNRDETCPFGSPSSPLWYNLRQPNTRLAFTSCLRATTATEAPRTSVSSTIRRFSSIVR